MYFHVRIPKRLILKTIVNRNKDPIKTKDNIQVYAYIINWKLTY